MNGIQLTSWQALRAGIISTTKAMLKWLVTNPAGWAIIATASIAALVKIVDELGVTVEEQRESLEKLKQEYSEITSELQSCNEELKTTEQRMRELEKIESPTFAEKEEYDNLVKTNNELQRKIDLLELEEKIKSQEARDAFVSTMEKDTDRYKDDSDEYFYYIDPNDPYQQKGLGKGSTATYSIGGFRIEAVPEDELIDVYENYANRLKELDEQYANDLENKTYKKTKATIEQEMADLAKYLSDKSSQWSSDANGIKYIQNPTTEDDKVVNEWLDYIADFQDRMAIAMGGSNSKTNAFNRVVDNWQFDETVQGLQDLGKEGKVTAEMLDDPKYDDFINKLVFLGVIDSADNLEDVALAFNSVAISAENAADSASKYTDKTDIPFIDFFNSADFAETKEKLLDLAKSGEITPEVLESTEEYKTLLEETGLSAEEATSEILNMLTAQEKLSAASKGLNNLSKSYKEFKDIGFVTASTLESLPDVFKNLPSYDIFSQIVGDPQSGVDKIQQAFNNIVKDYLITQDTLTGLLDASESQINSYVANLKQMGVENAQEVVNQIREQLKSESDLFNKAEEEYVNYLNSKDEAQLEFINSSGSYNSQLIAGLGETYKTDYDNWVSLLEKKTEAYNKFVEAIGGSYDENLSIQENMLKNGSNMSANAWANAYAAEAEYKKMKKEADKAYGKLKLKYASFKVDPSNFSFSGTKSSSSSSSSSEDTTDYWKQEFDNQLATLKHQLAMNQITEAQYYNTLDGLNKKYFANREEYLSEYRQYEEEVYKGLLSVQKDSLDAINDLIDLRKEMIKDIKEDEIDALKETIEAEKEKLDAINKSIDARKKAIELLKDEKDHDEEMAEKNKAISDIQIQIDRLALDNSATAQKKKRELEEELADKKKDLADYITDYEYDKAIEALDNEADIAEQEYEQLEENLNNQIDAIQTYLDDEKQLLLDATNDINGMNETLFNNMKNWAYETTGSVQEVVEKWKEAQKALELYNATNNVSGIKTTLEENNYENKVIPNLNSTPTPNTNANTNANENTNNTLSTRYYTIQSSKDTMWNLAQRYYGDGSKWTKIQQANGGISPESLRIGQKLIIPYRKGTKKVPENQIALTDEAGEELILHANDKGNLRILTKGSSVIPADLTENLMKWGEMNPDLLTQNLNINVPPVSIPNFERKEFTPIVNIGDIIINGDMGNLTKSDLNEFRKDIVNDVYESMQKNRAKSGRY